MEIINDIGNGQFGIVLTANFLLIMSFSLGIMLLCYWYWELSKKCDRRGKALVSIGKNMDELNASLEKNKEWVTQYKSCYHEADAKYKKKKEEHQALLRESTNWV